MALPFPRPASLDSSFTVSRATLADVDGLAKVYFDSFATDPNNTYWWSPDPDAMTEWLHARIRRKMSDRSVRHFQVLDAQKDIVAFVRWDIPEGYETEFGEWIGDDALATSHAVVDDGTEAPATAAPVEETEPAAAKTIETPRGSDPELCQNFFAQLATLSKKWNAHEMLGLSLLCTAPKYHRRGAAKALLVPMLAIADAVGVRSYVEATPAGLPLYEKLGFRVVEVMELDATAATGGKVKGLSTITIMIREPQPS